MSPESGSILASWCWGRWETLIKLISSFRSFICLDFRHRRILGHPLARLASIGTQPYPLPPEVIDLPRGSRIELGLISFLGISFPSYRRAMMANCVFQRVHSVLSGKNPHRWLRRPTGTRPRAPGFSTPFGSHAALTAPSARSVSGPASRL